MPVETMNKRLNRWLMEMANVRRRLSRLLTQHNRLWIDQPEGINHNLNKEINTANKSVAILLMHSLHGQYVVFW